MLTSNPPTSLAVGMRITHELDRRPSRLPDHAAENQALGALAQQLARDPAGLLQRVVELAMALCRAQSAGVSLLDEDRDRFVLPAVAGVRSDLCHDAFARDTTPSDAVIDENEVLLFRQPARAYPALAGDPPVQEALLAPWEVGGRAIGTLWVATHDPAHRFEAEDARLLQSLARFAAGAWHLHRLATGAEAERNKLRLRAEERANALSHGYEELRASEERLRMALEISRLGTWDRDLETGAVAWSDENYRILGYCVGEVEPTYAAWAARAHPDDLLGLEEAMVAARDTRSLFDRIYRLRLPNGEVRWCTAVGRFFLNAHGRPVRMIGLLRDVTERQEWGEAQDRLIQDLHARTRTLVGLLRGMAGQAPEGGDTLGGVRDRFEARLAALERAQGLLAEAAVRPVTLAALLRGELAGAEPDPRVTLEGPEAALHNATVQMLALALHELAAESRRFGALTSPEGRLTVTWEMIRRSHGARLVLLWRELGIAAQPGWLPHGSFGRDLIENALPHTLGADVALYLDETGLRCRIAIPMR